MTETLDEEFGRLAAPAINQLAESDNPVTWADVTRAIRRLADARGEWAGLPRPISRLKLQIEPRHPYQGLHGMQLDDEDGGDPYENLTDTELAKVDYAQLCEHYHIKFTPEAAKLWQLLRENLHGKLRDKLYEMMLGGREVNSWYCYRRAMHVSVWRRLDGMHEAQVSPTYGGDRFQMLIDTMHASQVWTMEAELRAMATLRSYLNDVSFERYVLTGTFLESSPKSGVFYLFRKLRPTLAFSSQGKEIKFLAGLCLHPIGLYHPSFAGCLTPTDDVIAHLLMMRGDEHFFWRKSSQHNSHTAGVGL